MAHRGFRPVKATKADGPAKPEFDKSKEASNLDLVIKYTTRKHGWCSPCFCSEEELNAREEREIIESVYPVRMPRGGRRRNLTYCMYTGEVDECEWRLLKTLLRDESAHIISAKVMEKLPEPIYVDT